MGMSFGFDWANLDLFSLSNTNYENRNYYYGLETFLFCNPYETTHEVTVRINGVTPFDICDMIQQK